jgi:hypothetical protein
MKDGERIFLTCKSKDCTRSVTNKRCTLSLVLFNNADGKLLALDLNNRKFCTLECDTPLWKVSPNKPGRKKLLAENKKANIDLDLLDLIGETGLEIT